MSAPWPAFPPLFFSFLWHLFRETFSTKGVWITFWRFLYLVKLFLLSRHGEPEQQGQQQQGCYTGVPEPLHSWAEAHQGAVDQGHNPGLHPAPHTGLPGVDLVNLCLDRRCAAIGRPVSGGTLQTLIRLAALVVPPDPVAAGPCRVLLRGLPLG